MTPIRGESAGLLAGWGVLAAGALALLVSVAAAVSLTPTPDAPAPQIVLPAARETAAAVPLPRIADIVDLNVFSPTRSAPMVPYRLAGNEVDSYAAAVTEAPEVILPVVLGTAVGMGATSFAMCSLAGAPTVVVRVGDQLGDYTVRSIARGEVEFSTPSGERVSINANPS